MRRFSFILCLTLLGLLLVACVQPIQSPIGKNPTKPFILTDQYLTDGAFFQQKENLVISGTSEEGVVIVATLYDENNRLIDQNYTYVMESGLWKIELKSPSASYKKYYLVIEDSVNQKTIKDIHFGDIWLLAGEGFVNIPLSEIRGPILEPTASPLVMGFYKQGFDQGAWIDPARLDFADQVSGFAYYFAWGLAQKLEIPIAVVLAQVEESHLDAWVSPELISTKETVRTFSTLTNRYKDEITGSKEAYDQMGYLFESKIRPVLKMRYQGILWYQGISDLQELSGCASEDKDQYLTLYSKALTYLFSDYYRQLDDEVDIYIIQEPSYEEDEFAEADIVGLRQAQAMGSYFYTYTTIVTTYDLHQTEQDDLELEAKALEQVFETEPNKRLGPVDIEKAAGRVVLATRTKTYHERNNYLAPNYTNIVISSSMVRIAFTSRLQEKKVINSLHLFDENGDEIAIDYEINQEWLTITWDSESDVALGKITYAWESNIVTSNLCSEYGVAVVPFQIPLA